MSKFFYVPGSLELPLVGLLVLLLDEPQQLLALHLTERVVGEDVFAVDVVQLLARILRPLRYPQVLRDLAPSFPLNHLGEAAKAL